MSGKTKWTGSLRLNFLCRDYEIDLVSSKRIEINPPPSETLNNKSGFSVNLIDENGKVFYSRMIRNPLRKEAEAFGQSKDEPITIETLDVMHEEFSVLIPDPGKVFELEIVNLPYVDEEGVTPVWQTFSFTIDPSVETAPAAVALEGLEDGRVVGAQKIVDHGGDKECWNIALLAEGYQPHELDKFSDDAGNFANYLSGLAPFSDFWLKTNVYRVDVESTDSGADLPGHCADGQTVNVRTYFNASFCGAGSTTRLLVVDKAIAKRVWQEHVPTAHAAIVIVNSETYGGSGGEVPVFSTNSSAALIGIHELGHSFFNLADEYETPYINDDPDKYPNLTSKTDLQEIKWADLIAPETPVPTSRNNCPQTGSGFSHPVPAGTVGLFEGGLYKSCNVFRAERSCLMRNFSQPRFCAVCERAIREKLLSLVQIDTPIV